MHENSQRAFLIRKISDEIRMNVGGAGSESDEEIRMRIEEYVFHSALTRRMNSVSYTHLDVYKRQVQEP